MPELTNHSQIKLLCEKHGFSFSKGFGQNFIVNEGICPKICDAAGIDSQSSVLEIGPGFGTLSQQLATRAKKVVAVEIDKRLLPVLSETMAGFNNFSVVQSDVLKLNLAQLLQTEFGEPAIVCANLPYYITSPVLMKLLEERLNITKITVMVQREAAQRIVAKPGTREAGAISYAVHYFSKPCINFTVSPGSFFPPPKIKSSVISLEVRQNPALAQSPAREKRLFALIRASFSQRRKTLANAASATIGVDKTAIANALEIMQCNSLARPEQLTLEQFITLEGLLWQS